MRLCKGSIDGVTHCCYIEQDLVKSSASLGELYVSAAYIQDIVAGKAMISAKISATCPTWRLYSLSRATNHPP